MRRAFNFLAKRISARLGNIKNNDMQRFLGFYFPILDFSASCRRMKNPRKKTGIKKVKIIEIKEN